MPLENITSPELHFLDVPKGDDMRLQDLAIDDDYLIFEAVSNVMGYLQPGGLPLGIIRAAFQDEIPVHILGFQIVKLEIMSVLWIVFWGILSLCVSISVLANFCCVSNIRRLNNDFSNGSFDTSERWTENSIGCLLHGLLILLLGPIILILAGNEQISRSISKSPMAANVIYEDINTFIRNSHMQISFVTTSSTDIAMEAIRKDLDDVHLLLGRPYQKELSLETGLEKELVALDELKIANKKVTSLVTDLLHDCDLAKSARKSVQEQLNEVSRQLTLVRRQCNIKDRALCYTLQFLGFEVYLPLQNLTNDDSILQLQRMDYEEKFNLSIATAKKTFADVPDRVDSETAHYIADIKSALSKRRTEVYKSVHGLDILARSLTDRVTVSQNSNSATIKEIADWDMWRWLGILVIAAMISLIWGLLLCGAPCGCGLTSKTVPFLISGVSLSCIMAVIVWALAATSFVLAGYGHSVVCGSLYDQPHYETLSELLDAGGMLYKDDGFFVEFGDANKSVKVADVLKNCQRNQAVYHTFHLENKLNIEKVINYKSWDELKTIFYNFSTSKGSHLEILNPSLQDNLQILASMSTINLTTYRNQLSSPLTKSDLGSFADQLNTVGRQLVDPIEARKIDNLAFLIRRIVQQEMAHLMKLRNSILYKITTLEVLLPPLSQRANQSLSHLKTVQIFLGNNDRQIAERMRRQFIARIENYLEDLYKHIHEKFTKEIGKSRPLFDIFHSTRFTLCKLIVNPTNGISASCFILILVFVTLVPVVGKLVDFYRENDNTSHSHRRSRDGIIIDDEGTWATPTSGSPESVVPHSRLGGEHPPTVSWSSPSPPRQSLEGVIPPPPQMPQIPSISRTVSPQNKFTKLASRITGTRNLSHQLPSISRSRTPRRGRESLHLIEPIHWKSGSTTPRSWI